MIIIIDGYNLLKQLYPNNKENLDLQKKILLKALGIYKNVKKQLIKEIIIVFDGGSLVHAVREIHYGIVSLESGYKKSADDWIIEYTRKYKTQEITIISMDRDLCLACEKTGAFSMNVFDFIKIIQDVIKENTLTTPLEGPIKNSIQKYSTPNTCLDIDIPSNDGSIDSLMTEGSLMQPSPKKDNAPQKETNASIKNKNDRNLFKKLKKIY